MQQSKSFYVYVYLDPRKSGTFSYGKYVFDHEPSYVGKGCKYRINAHLWESELNRCDRNQLKINKIKKIKILKFNPILIKYMDNLTESKALNLEEKMIYNIGRIDLKTGPLTNLTNGGKKSCPFLGKHHTKQTKEKMSKSKIGENSYWFNKHFSNITKEKMSKSHLGKKKDGKTKEKIRKSHLGLKQSLKTRKRMSIAQKQR